MANTPKMCCSPALPCSHVCERLSTSNTCRCFRPVRRHAAPFLAADGTRSYPVHPAAIVLWQVRQRSLPCIFFLKQYFNFRAGNEFRNGRDKMEKNSVLLPHTSKLEILQSRKQSRPLPVPPCGRRTRRRAWRDSVPAMAARRLRTCARPLTG